MRIDVIQSDFDRIARLTAHAPERPDRYESFLLAQLPAHCREVLDVGCGAGRLARAIARRGANVTGIDASAEMIRLARERTHAGERVAFRCADFSVQPLDLEFYDAVVSVATVHHLPIAMTLAHMKTLVAPGGVLVVNDLRAPAGKGDWLRSAIAAGFNGDALWWLRNRLRTKPALRAAWRDHGLGERYLTMEQVRALCETTLPGARAHWHALWRYTIVWTKGKGAPAHSRR